MATIWDTTSTGSNMLDLKTPAISLIWIVL